MKKPYVKELTKVSGFVVWCVDGKYVRKNINEEFTNYASHINFKFIPKNEFWIDNERTPGEEKFYIDSMLTMNKLMAKGISHKKAAEVAEKIEKTERSKSRLMKEKIKFKWKNKKLIEEVHKKLIKKYSNGIQVWIVRGEAVRDFFFIDFTEGGHDKVYNFVPENEVWIDDDVMPGEIKFVLLHELHERKLMSQGQDYEHAHRKSSEREFFCRCHPEELDKYLSEDLKENKLLVKKKNLVDVIKGIFVRK